MTTRVLMVCLGNICRSPTAEAALREAVDAAGLDVEVESAGTGAWHVGNPPDHRMTAAAADVDLHLSGAARRAAASPLLLRHLSRPVWWRARRAASWAGARMRSRDGVTGG